MGHGETHAEAERLDVDAQCRRETGEETAVVR